MDGERRKALVGEIVDACAERAQRVHQVADRPLVHARHAREAVFAARKSQRRGERPERGAGVAQEELGLLDGESASHPCDDGVVEPNAQSAQRLAHHPRIVGVEQAADFGLALRQRREQQNAVGNALRAGQAHRAGRAARRLQLE